MAIRGWMAGWKDNQPASEYTVDFLEQSHARGIVFMGGITGSAVFREDAGSDAEFEDWITRDAWGDPVPHTEAPMAGMHRGSIANPSYRRHLLDKMRLQIDLGVDGLAIDEVDGAYSGGRSGAGTATRATTTTTWPTSTGT